MAIGFNNMESKDIEKKSTYIPRRKVRLPKGRSITTYQNKLRKLKSFYRKTFEHSKEQKKRNDASAYKIEKRYFFEKYPTEKSFLKLVTLKEPTKK